MSDDAPMMTPRTNPVLFGHENAELLLRDAFRAGSLAHAWLFAGPEGIGKATLAYRFARYVLKHSGHAPEPIASAVPDAESLFGDLPAEAESNDGAEEGLLAVEPNDPVFRRVTSGGHADLAVVERAVKTEKTGERYNVIRVDDVRSVGGFLRMTPAEGGWRVVIVDAADDMNLNAQNALLKILEEPPPQSLIILVAHVPGRLLPTIRSRCRVLPLRRLDDDTVVRLIHDHAPTTPAEGAAEIAAAAEGSIGRALRMIAGDGNKLSKEINSLFDNLPSLDVVSAHDLAGRLARKAADRSYTVALDLIDRRLRAQIRASALEPAKAGSLESWLEVWDNSLRLRDRAESVNLDRKQVILGILHAAAEAAGARM